MAANSVDKILIAIVTWAGVEIPVQINNGTPAAQLQRPVHPKDFFEISIVTASFFATRPKMAYLEHVRTRIGDKFRGCDPTGLSMFCTPADMRTGDTTAFTTQHAEGVIECMRHCSPDLVIDTDLIKKMKGALDSGGIPIELPILPTLMREAMHFLQANSATSNTDLEKKLSAIVHTLEKPILDDAIRQQNRMTQHVSLLAAIPSAIEQIQKVPRRTMEAMHASGADLISTDNGLVTRNEFYRSIVNEIQSHTEELELLLGDD